MGRSNGSSTAVVLAFCITLIMMLPEVSAKRFIVGGNVGWSSEVNYTLWAENQTFILGDWLFFVYDRKQDAVIEVNKTNFETCNAKHSVHNYTTGYGRDIVRLNVTHDRYFISSKWSCNGGMKFKVHLTPLPPPPPVNLAPSPSPVNLVPSPLHVNHAPLPPPPLHLTPLPQPPRAATSRSHSSTTRFPVLGSQLVIPVVITIAAIWDTLLRVW